MSRHRMRTRRQEWERAGPFARRVMRAFRKPPACIDESDPRYHETLADCMRRLESRFMAPPPERCRTRLESREGGR